jgi:hypothetical protein
MRFERDADGASVGDLCSRLELLYLSTSICFNLNRFAYQHDPRQVSSPGLAAYLFGSFCPVYP